MNIQIQPQNKDTLILGAVAYDPKVVAIWDGFKTWFAARGLPFDYVLFTNYESQVEAHVRGAIDVAWNSPLAWIESLQIAHKLGRSAHAIAMRDTDMDLCSAVLVRADSSVTRVSDLKGKRIGVGAHDSPQATLIPLYHLSVLGIEAGRDAQIVVHDVLTGKHGDHIGGERDAVKVLLDGRVDAVCVLDANTLGFTREGTIAPGSTRLLTQTAPYDHCNFTVFDDPSHSRFVKFRELLLGMSYEDPSVRHLLDLEGLKQWKIGRTAGYEILTHAVAHFHTTEPWLASQGGL